MLGIQKTIAIAFEWHGDFIGNMDASVEYAQHVYLDPHRYTIRLFERLFKFKRMMGVCTMTGFEDKVTGWDNSGVKSQ